MCSCTRKLFQQNSKERVKTEARKLYLEEKVLLENPQVEVIK